MLNGVALGTFDGMHPGHQAVIDTTVEYAKKNGLKSLVFTFTNIPRSIFSKAPVPIMTSGERENAIRARGVDDVIMTQFSEAFSRMSPEAFVEMIVTEHHPAALVSGEDYTFGYKASGNTDMLKRFGREMGFEVITVKTLRLLNDDGTEGEKISSTGIRRAIQENRPELIESYMHGKNTSCRGGRNP